MIPLIYQIDIEQQLAARQSLLLSPLVTEVMHTIGDVQLKTMAKALRYQFSLKAESCSALLSED